MSYRNTDVPDSTIVQVSLTIKQVKALDKLAELDLAEAETYGISTFPKRELQRLIDVFHPIINIPLTEAEEQAKLDAWRRKYTADAYEQAHGVKP